MAKERKLPRKPLTDEQVNVFAKRLYRGEIYTSAHLGPHEEHLMTSVFMTLAFMTPAQAKQMAKDGAHVLYAPLDEARIARYVNGHPMLLGPLGFWTRDEWDRIRSRVKAIEDMLGDTPRREAP